MKIVFIGGFFVERRYDEFKRYNKGIFQYAANVFQNSFLKGFKDNRCEIDAITMPFLGNYPTSYAKLFTAGSVFTEENINIYSTPVLHLPVIGLIVKHCAVFFYLFKKYRKVNTPQFIVYSAHLPLLTSTVLFKLLINRKTRICLILPDLPIFFSSSKNIIYVLFKHVNSVMNHYLFKFMDSFVFITAAMNAKVNKKNKPYIVLEGMYDDLTPVEANVSVNKVDFRGKKTILYTGTLDRRYGILNLLCAFSKITDDSFRLWICGAGNMQDEVIASATLDKRIHFFGQLNHGDVLALQSKATVLINPRPLLGEYTKYSFPIKTMEYIASAKPTIGYKLHGIPEEYYPYMYFIEDEGVDAIVNKIYEVCMMDGKSLYERGQKAREFILKTKSPKYQVRRILKLVNNE